MSGIKRPPLIPKTTQSRFAPLYLSKDDEPTIWDICNERSLPIDKDLIKDWTETLTFLLVFAALYSGILSAFIVQSMSLLQEDTQSTANDILLHISSQLANRTTGPYDPTPFTTPIYAIRVNACLFASISCSLVTALASIIVLQWIGNYDANLTRSSTPKDRAVRRYFRWKGVKRWRLSKIISAIVHLLFASLLLFFAGTVDWLWHINIVVGAVALAGYSLGGLFWVGTTVVLSFDPSAPFRTSLSKALVLPSGETIRSWFTRGGETVAPHHYHTSQGLSFHKREDILIRHNAELEQSTIMWLLKTLDTSLANNKSYISALEYLLTLPAETLANRITDDAPWVMIYSLLLVEHYDFGTTPGVQHTQERQEKVKFLLVSLAVIGNWIADPFITSFLELTAQESDEFRILAELALWKHSPHREDSSFGRSLCSQLATQRHKLSNIVLHSMIIGMRRDIGALRTGGNLFQPMVDGYLQTLTHICLAPINHPTKEPLHADILATVMSIVLQEDPLGSHMALDVTPSEYISHTSEYPCDDVSDFISLHKAVQIQIISQLSTATTKEMAYEMLDPVWKMVRSAQWTQRQDSPVLLLIQEIIRLQRLNVSDPDPDKPEEQIPWTFKIISVALPTRYFPRRRDHIFNQQQAVALLVRSMLQGVDQLQQHRHWYPDSMSNEDARLVLMQLMVNHIASFSISERAQWAGADRNALKELQDPAFYLLASALTTFPWDRPIPERDDIIWKDKAWTLAVEYCRRQGDWVGEPRNQRLIGGYRSFIKPSD